MTKDAAIRMILKGGKFAPMIQTENLENFQEPIRKAADAIAHERIIERIWKIDWKVWKDDPREIRNRLGWLSAPETAEKNLGEIESFVRGVQKDGYTQALLLGMGGSSLAAEVLAQAFQTPPGFCHLEILDSTDPGAVLKKKNSRNPNKTLFIVSSKSGTTVETTSFFNFFYTWVWEALGEDKAGAHFAAITDAATPLEELAHRFQFRAIFQGDPEIGGRFSALSVFGLVPGALKGIDVKKLIENAKRMAGLCQISSSLQDNPGAFLGTVLGVLARAGKDKLTFILPPELKSFGFWLEQLIAESTGKEGKGILPVAEEPVGAADVYAEDRLFVRIRLRGDKSLERTTQALKKAGFPLIDVELQDFYSFGGQFFLWEFATAIAGHLLGINPFEQPNVDSAKKKAQEALKIFKEKGALPFEKPQLAEDGISIFYDQPVSSLNESLDSFLRQTRPGDYIAIQAFLEPNREIDAALQKLRVRLRGRTKLAVTSGFGPRFLHSTGQLHKGDRGNGLFIQLTADPLQNVPVPDEPGVTRSSITFSMLNAAQAQGDLAALRAAGRRTIRIHFRENPVSGLEKIISSI